MVKTHAVAGLHIERLQLTLLVGGARADGHDLALLGLFLGGVGNDDAAGGPIFGLDPANDHAVVQRAEFHWLCPLVGRTAKKPREPWSVAVGTLCSRVPTWHRNLGLFKTASREVGDARLGLDPAVGHIWFEELTSVRAVSIIEIAEREGVLDRFVSILVNLAFLAPSLVDAIVDGRQPAEFTAKGLMFGDDIPALWRVAQAMSGGRAAVFGCSHRALLRESSAHTESQPIHAIQLLLGSAL